MVLTCSCETAVEQNHRNSKKMVPYFSMTKALRKTYGGDSHERPLEPFEIPSKGSTSSRCIEME